MYIFELNLAYIFVFRLFFTDYGRFSAVLLASSANNFFQPLHFVGSGGIGLSTAVRKKSSWNLYSFMTWSGNCDIMWHNIQKIKNVIVNMEGKQNK